MIVDSINLFARNPRSLLELAAQPTKRSAEFVSKEEPIDITTPSRKLMLAIFGATYKHLLF